MKACTASSSCCRLGSRTALGRDVGPIDDDVCGHVPASQPRPRLRTRHRGVPRVSQVSATAPPTGDPTDEVTDLLQHLIRNACVNDGSVESGQEGRSADTLTSYLEGSGVDIERYEPEPGRGQRGGPHRGQRPHGADPAADGPHRRGAGERRPLAAGSLRRRAGRRCRVGPRGGRHAQPDRLDGGGHQTAGRHRLPPQGHAHLPGGGR